MRVLGVPEWIVVIVQAMYNDAKSKVRVNGSYSDEFEVKVGVHQGSVLSPLLFNIVLEVLSMNSVQVVLGNLFMMMILC